MPLLAVAILLNVVVLRLIEANVLKQGRTLAFLEVELRKRSNIELLVKGSHTISRVPGGFQAAPSLKDH